MALSIGIRNSISLLSAIQATRPLTLTLVGLSPTEHTSFSWTRCRTAEFLRSGWKSWPVDGEPSHPRRGSSAGTHTPQHAWFAHFFVPFPTSAYPGTVSERRLDHGTTKYPESLCLISALPLSGRRASPPAGTLLPGLGSYGLMRRSRAALLSFGLSLVRGVSAVCNQPLLLAGPSRRYLCESFPGCLDPCHGGTWSAFTCFFLHLIGLPPYTIEVGFPAFAHQKRFLDGSLFRDCSHFFMFRPPGLLTPQIVPTAVAYRLWAAGAFIRAEHASFPPHASDIANHPNTGN